MALSKSIPTEYGTPATYHHVCAVLWDKTAPMVQVQLASYINVAARNLIDGKPIGRIDFQFPKEILPSMDIVSIYGAIKATSGWTDAEDC